MFLFGVSGGDGGGNLSGSVQEKSPCARARSLALLSPVYLLLAHATAIEHGVTRRAAG